VLAWYVPTEQTVQALDPAVDETPTPQLAQLVETNEPMAAVYVPATQLTQAKEPLFSWYVPARQLMQLLALDNE
jgi:hypothetical protein